MKKQTLAALFLTAAVLLSATLWAYSKKKDKAGARMDDRQRALHALNRLTFGPRPGDVDRVMRMGVDKWIDQQLHPEKIDDSALEARLEPLRTLRMSREELVQDFPPPQVIKQVADGKIALPSDPAKRAIYQQQLERYQNRQERKAEKGAPAADASGAQAADPSGQMMSEDERAARREARMYAEENAQKIIDLPPDKRFQAILKMTPEERQALARSLPPEQREQLMNSLTPEQRERLMAMVNPQQVVTTELMEGKILRAAYSERQLDEVMTDFWFNHFNVFIGKGPDRYMISSYERDVIRPHALGKFKDLLLATAKSPAMLFFLDNWQSVGPHSDFATGRRRNPPPRMRPMRPFGRGPFGGPFGMPPVPRPQQQRRPPDQAKARKNNQGLNENYGRELMELHTLGVDGGYSQKDVTEVAKIFTGWTIKEPQRGGEFEFDERRHEPGPKHVLGKTIKENGEKEGEELLLMLARNPSTAHFISKEIAMRFVSDDPPQALVDRMAKTFLKSDGDIRAVLKTMLDSPEFWDPAVFRAKVKTPLEFVVSAVRASGADISNALPLVQTLNQMGMPLYGDQPPTGYPMKAEAWVNSAALLNRMNFALRFASGHMPGISFDSERVLGSPQPPSDPQQALAQLENSLLAGDVSAQTHQTISKQLESPEVTGRVLDDPQRPPNVGVIAGLILGSPEFQRR